MECNRDEALKAREIAERKFTSKDVAGAKKFALKAQNLFPELEGINQMIATLDIYLASEVKINGESDWYAILSVNALADDETVKKQYRKLALQLHPDKNKCVGAEGAFKLISEAWSVLSDKSRKMAYDQSRSVKGSQQRVSHHNNKHSVPNTNNGFYNFANNASLKSKSQKSSTASVPTTFWTSCNRCKMQYEYLRVYLNHNLLCPNCHEAFVAVETGIPMNGATSKFSWTAPQQSQQMSKRKSTLKNTYDSSQFHHGANHDSYSNPNFQWAPFSSTSGVGSATNPSFGSAQAANMVHQTYEKVKRECEEAQAAVRRDRRKNSFMNGTASGYNDVAACNVPKVDRLVKKRRSITDDNGTGGGVGTQKMFAENRNGNNCSNDVYEVEKPTVCVGNARKVRMSNKIYKLSRENSEVDKRRLLMEKAKRAISRKLEEWNAVQAVKQAENLKGTPKHKHKSSCNDKIVSDVRGHKCFYKKWEDPRNKTIPGSGTKEPFHNGMADSVKPVVKAATIVVPDPEFHDFDKDRLERSFERDQVWATYDSEDGMPRLYVLVQKVLSLRPFRLRLSFLNSKSNSELGPMNWVASGYAKTCGNFRVGRYQVNDTVNIFSHRVRSEKGARGVIRIVPRKGDTWALYKNWSPDWNELTPDDMIYKYDIVEVIDDFNEDQGVTVTPLVKIAGFRAVFHRHMDPKEVKRIPKEEMFRFSHQVPSYLLTGEEAHNAPKGCRELDPAGIPSEFLQVITEFKDDEVMDTSEQQPVS